MEENEEQTIPLRRIILWGAAVVLSLGLCVGAGIAAWPRYKTWSSTRALKEAQEAHLAGEYRRQQLFLEQAVQMDASNLDARRLLAAFAQQAGLPQASELWASLADLEPTVMENHRGLVLTLLRKQQLTEAGLALSRVPESLRSTVEYHRLAAALAMSAGNAVELEAELKVLAGLESSPEALLVPRAALGLRSPDAAVRASAQEQLEQLARQDAYRIRATLCLLRSLTPTQPGAQASVEPLAERVLGAKVAGSALLPRVRPSLSDLLAHMMAQASPKSEDVAELMQWMRQQGLAREALFWCLGQTEELRKDPRVLVERAGCAMQCRQWRELREAVALGVWGQVSDEVLTLVFASRIQRESGSLSNSRATWADALTLAERNPGAMRALLRLAQGWGWKGEAERCLQVLVRFYPRDDALWGAMFYQAQSEGQTDKTLQVLESWSRAQGEPVRVLGELMLLSSLLDRLGAEQQERLQKAASLPEATMTLRLAAALQASRKLAPGVAPVVPEGVDVASLTPRARLAWAQLLVKAGKAEAARRAVEGLGQISFLPEEKALLAKLQ